MSPLLTKESFNTSPKRGTDDLNQLGSPGKRFKIDSPTDVNINYLESPTSPIDDDDFIGKINSTTHTVGL